MIIKKNNLQNLPLVILEISEEKAVLSFTRPLSSKAFKELTASVKEAERELGIKLIHVFFKQIKMDDALTLSASESYIIEKAKAGEAVQLLLKAGANPLNWYLVGPNLFAPNAMQQAAMNGSCDILQAMFDVLDKNLHPTIVDQLFTTIPLAPHVQEFLSRLTNKIKLEFLA